MTKLGSIVTGYGTSSNFGTLTNLTFLFFSSTCRYYGTSLSLFAIAMSIIANCFDLSLISILSSAFTW